MSLEQNDTLIYCDEIKYIKVNEFNVSWYFIEGVIVGNHVVIIANASSKYWDS